MARLKVSETPGLEDEIYDATPPPTNRSSSTNVSDKENRTSNSREKARQVPPSSISRGMSDMSSNGASRPAKRKAPAQERERRQRQRTATPSSLHSSPSSEDPYNPDQSIEERRHLRAELHGLEKELNENRAEYLQPNNDGLKQTLINADKITAGVKQTGDATIDSRLLVNTADLSLKKVEKLTLGNNQLGVDVDHFIAKCMSYMRNGGAARVDGSGGSGSGSLTRRNGTQRRRATQNGNADSDSEDGESGDMLDWASLGRYACLPRNSRPSVPGFLFGPLSIAKRVRRATQRRTGNSNKDLVETRPEILRAEDLYKEDNNNLTVLCHKINTRLAEVSEEQMNAAEDEAMQRPTQLEDWEMKKLCLKYGIDYEGNVDLFRFVINPNSFGQTIENMFYVSFLIRDGSVGIVVSNEGLPYLKPHDKTPSEARTHVKGVMKHQAVLSLDMETWEELVDAFEITEPMIPHRVESATRELGARGWYT